MDLIAIGRIVRTHGYKGQVRVRLYDNIKELLNPEALFLSIGENQLPYFFSEMRETEPGELLVHFEDFKSKEEAHKHLKVEVLAKPEDVDAEEPFDFDTFIGFTAYHQETEELGQIKEINYLPQQELALVIHQGKEILIPLVEPLLIEIDMENRRLIFDLPEGFLDI